MIKHYKDLTPQDKQKFISRTIWEMENIYNVPWPELEAKMQAFLDAAFDDSRFPMMSSDDVIDASYCRKEFQEKPDLIDFMIWQGRFVTKSDYIEIPD